MTPLSSGLTRFVLQILQPVPPLDDSGDVALHDVHNLVHVTLQPSSTNTDISILFIYFPLMKACRKPSVVQTKKGADTNKCTCISEGYDLVK